MYGFYLIFMHVFALCAHLVPLEARKMESDPLELEL